jgi:hypothetical protein
MIQLAMIRLMLRRLKPFWVFKQLLKESDTVVLFKFVNKI